MQEYVDEKTVAFSIKGAKLTGRMLAKAMQVFLKKMREPPKGRTGKQSIRSLTKQGASLTNIPITGENIGDFKKTARKYNVSFALQRDDSTSPPKWIVFCKAKDTDSMMAAISEYTKIKMKVKEKPALLNKLAKFKELAKQLASPVKNRNRGEREI